MMQARVILTLVFAIFIVSCDRFVFREVVVFVLPQTVPCSNSKLFHSTDTCLQISENSAGPFFFNQISGFTHEAGFRYKLRVKADWQSNEDVVGAQAILQLLETLEKTPAQ
jgi:Domain of unknown function (DUF4377)